MNRQSLYILLQNRPDFVEIARTKTIFEFSTSSTGLFLIHFTLQVSCVFIIPFLNTRLRTRASNSTAHGYYIVRYERTDSVVGLWIHVFQVLQRKRLSPRVHRRDCWSTCNLILTLYLHCCLRAQKLDRLEWEHQCRDEDMKHHYRLLQMASFQVRRLEML